MIGFIKVHARVNENYHPTIWVNISNIDTIEKVSVEDGLNDPDIHATINTVGGDWSVTETVEELERAIDQDYINQTARQRNI